MKGTLDPRTFAIATFALCASPISAPSASRSAASARSHRAAQPARKIRHPAMLAGTMANLMSASIVGSFRERKKKLQDQRFESGFVSKNRCCDPGHQFAGGEYERAGKAADFIFSQTAHRPKIALVLAQALAHSRTNLPVPPKFHMRKFRTSSIDRHWPCGEARHRKSGAIAVAGMQGRVHLYEGYSAKEWPFPFAFSRAWCKGRDPHQRRRRHQTGIRAGPLW